MILLKDLFRFEDLLTNNYENKRIKLRFNTNWVDSDLNQKYDFSDMYVSKSLDFEPYILSIGSKKKSRNSDNDIQFQFIEVEYHKWLFVGAYEILSASSKLHTNIHGVSFNYADARRLTQYDKFIDRVLLDWTNKPQQFFYVNKDIIDSITIDQVCSKPYFEMDKNFPGFENLSLSYQELKSNMRNKSWIEQLSSVYGVYLITDKKAGKLYVGAAYGSDGIYGRWTAYLKDGYDKDELESSKYPNIKLKCLVNKESIIYVQENFQYSILEIFQKTEIGKQQTLVREKYWKKVFKSIEFGYNGN